MEKGKQTCKIQESKDKWKNFLLSIKPLGYSPTKKIITVTESQIDCLATTVADQLDKQKDNTVGDKGNQDHDKHLEASKNQTETPTAKNDDGTILEVLQTDASESVNEESAQNDDAVIREVPQTDANEHVKASAQNDDGIIPGVLQTDASESVNEESAQNDGAVIQEVPQTDVSEHVKEASAQNDDGTIPEVPQIDATEHVKEASAQNDDGIIPGVLQTDANESVNEEYAQNDGGVISEVSQTDANEHVKETSAPHDDNINTIEEELQTDETINPNRDRDRHTTSNANDINESSSGWEVSMIAEYVNFDNCIIKIEMPTAIPLKLDNIYVKVKTAINTILKIVKGSDFIPNKENSDSEFLKEMLSKTSIEAGSRLVLDALLVPLCSELDLQFEVEQSINCKSLPNCRFDYCIRKGKHIIGCIEAKSVKKLSDSSIAQAVLQLTVLQAILIGKVEISEFPVFAIVTDGNRFIYMQLKGSSLGFEHDGGKLMIRKVKQMDDFRDILRHIMFLVEEAVILTD